MFLTEGERKRLLDASDLRGASVAGRQKSRRLRSRRVHRPLRLHRSIVFTQSSLQRIPTALEDPAPLRHRLPATPPAEPQRSANQLFSEGSAWQRGRLEQILHHRHSRRAGGGSLSRSARGSPGADPSRPPPACERPARESGWARPGDRSRPRPGARRPGNAQSPPR